MQLRKLVLLLVVDEVVGVVGAGREAVVVCVESIRV